MQFFSSDNIFARLEMQKIKAYDLEYIAIIMYHNQNLHLISLFTRFKLKMFNAIMTSKLKIDFRKIQGKIEMTINVSGCMDIKDFC